MTRAVSLTIAPLASDAFAPYGWVLGQPYGPGDPRPGFSHPGSDFWHEHAFDTGGGETEVLWVNYRNAVRVVRTLEVHLLTEQAIVPLGGAGILHVVAGSHEVDGSVRPDLATARVFEVAGNQGICMKPRVWHTSLVRQAQTTCVMLTRRSTTLDLVHHLAEGSPPRESLVADLQALELPLLHVRD